MSKVEENTVVVIKMGGSFLEYPEGLNAFMEDVAYLYNHGLKVVIVHGGGKEINARLKKMDIPSEFKAGYRVTDEASMEEVEMTLSGKINKALAHSLGRQGVKALGLSGKDGQLLKVRKKWILNEDKVLDLGLVGEVISVEPEILHILTQHNYVPVISPIGFDEGGQTYNINADLAASAIAGALKSKHLILMTDVKGLYLTYPDESTFMETMTVAECQRFLDNGTDHKGMKPKIESAIEAIHQGTNTVTIINGSEPHSLVRAMMTEEKVGTVIC